MTIKPISTLSAGPLLHLRLARCERLALYRPVVCEVVVREPCCVQAGPIGTESFPCWRLAQHLPNEFIQLQADHWEQGQLQLRRTLGQDLFLGTVLAGSDSWGLPIANCVIEQQCDCVGGGIDVIA